MGHINIFVAQLLHCTDLNFVTSHLKNMPRKGVAFIFHNEFMVMLDTGLSTPCFQADFSVVMALAEMWSAAETGEISVQYFSWF